ncbi:uncharacterized protein LOC107633090 [Arachis ipaensis]|uniref:uncharacterized protein LOC107633090 n=1 Tax=Arachis ipaensis TaxID=130454 RepID=UPI0007AFD53C|nr:uncharacterized protein LOC107633090 [Arachis ipaensis]
MVKVEWRNLGKDQFTNKLKALTTPLRKWHKDNFGDMDKRIKQFEEEIKKIDDMVIAGRYDGTVEARRKALVTCCAKWYARKEIHWKQMSRFQHARDMDKNTRYFHNLASARRKNNRIDSLVINGRLVRNQSRIKGAITGFYKDLYRRELAPTIGICDGLVKQIEDEEAAMLETMPSPEEIREAVWDCESSNAPGSDGYNMNFIKKCWGEIGQEFTTAVLDFFQSAKLPTDANVTWVTLAPKFMGAKEIKDLRLISMVGCVYKVISKVLVRRMRSVVPGLVGKTQSAFVKGCKIHDGALIACETVQWLKVRKKQAAIIKLDFQKAYDRVRWSFVDIVLQKMGFSLRWRTWVKEYVTTASMSVFINGSPSKPFRMKRGLRQRDPLSPFLFVLVVDVLHKMVGEAVKNGRISPLLVGRDNIELLHLQFSDDTILFCPQETEIIVNYKRLLHCFKLMSGLSINFEKSILISINCEQEWVTNMCGLLGCAEATLPVRYLCISLDANPHLVKTWKSIIDKVEDKLSLWKAKSLNKAGKLVLIKSVLNSLTVYYLSLYKMPKVVAEKIIGLQRRFFGVKRVGKMTLPSRGGLWKDICQLNIKEQQVLQQETLSKDITSNSFTSTLWRGLVPPRVELFARFVLVGRVNTKERLNRLGIIHHGDNICVLCKKEIEFVNHLFLGCEFTWQVWCAWLMTVDRSWAVPKTVKELFESWIEAPGRKSEQKKWLIGFFTIIWNIWLERNSRVFRNCETGVDGIKNGSFVSYKEWCGVSVQLLMQCRR